jgi:hypothetical protein
VRLSSSGAEPAFPTASAINYPFSASCASAARSPILRTSGIGRCSFARFSEGSLTLDIFDKTLPFALTVAISYLSWRFVEQPIPFLRNHFAKFAHRPLVLFAER